MATSSAQQQTFTLLLQAQDQASQHIQAVGQQLQKLGEGTSLAGLSGQLRELGAHLAGAGDAAKAGFAAMEDAASYGTAAITDTIRTAALEQTEAITEALAKQTAAYKEAAREQEGVEKEHESILSRLREHLEKPIEFAKMAIGFEAGMAALSAFTEGIHELPHAFIEAATEGEQFTTQMRNFYGSAQAAGQVLDYVNAQGLKMPFTVAQIRQAVASLSETGIDPSKALAPLGNIAAAYGSQITDVVDVVNRAIATGSSRGLESYLHMTRQQLAAAGVAWDAHGKLISSSVLPALEHLGQTRFGEAMARQADTAQGALVRIANAWDLFKESAGEGLMKGMAGPLRTVTDWISTHQAQVQRWGEVVGSAIAKVGAAAMAFAGWMVHNFGPPVVAVVEAVGAVWQRLGPVIAGAVHVISAMIGGIGTVLQQDVLPVVQNAIGQMKEWWDEHGRNIAQIWTQAKSAADTFWTWLGPTVKNVMMEMQGYWTIAWGVISGVVGIAIDVITGDWKKAHDDLIGIWQAIEVGVLKIVNALADEIIHVFALLKDPMVAVLNAVFTTAFKAVVDVGVTLFTFMTLKIEQLFKDMGGNVAKTMLGVVATVGSVMEKLPGGLPVVGAMLTEGTKLLKSSRGGDTSAADQRMWAQSTAAGTGAASAAGAMLGPSPIKPISFNEGQATATVDAYFKALQRQVDPTGKLGTTATDIGKKWWDSFIGSVTGALKDARALDLRGLSFPTLVGGPVAGGGPGTADNTAAQDAYQRAKDLFDLFLKQGAPGGLPAGLGDIAAIARTGHAAGETDTQVQNELLGNTNQLIDKLLAQAHDHFELDMVNHASQRKLLQDENNYLAIMAKTPGITPAQIALQRHQLDVERTSGIPSAQELVARRLAADQQTLDDMRTLHSSVQQMMPVMRRIMADYAQQGIKPGSLHYRALQQQLLDQVTGGGGGTMPAVPSPAYGTYGGLATGYGQTTVSFGGTQQSGWAAVVAELRAQLAFWRSRALAEQRQLDAQQQTAQNTAQIARNTQSAADKMDQPGRGSAAAPVATAVRGVGGFQVMRRV